MNALVRAILAALITTLAPSPALAQRAGLFDELAPLFPDTDVGNGAPVITIDTPRGVPARADALIARVFRGFDDCETEVRAHRAARRDLLRALTPADAGAPPPRERAEPSIDLLDADGSPRLICRLDGRELMTTPPEGIWSIGSGWQDDWPARWHHGGSASAEHVGDWLVLRGHVDTPEGVWEVRDAYRAQSGAVKGIRRWTWGGARPSPPTVLSVRWRTPGTGTGVVLPGNLYHGNPSGRRSREEGWPGLVPVYAGTPRERLYLQEHRYTAPFASIEWARPDAEGFGDGAALHALPSPTPFGVAEDLWWSLGLTAGEGHTELALLSGPVALNGADGVVKSRQRSTHRLEDAHLRVPAGGTVEKTFYLQPYAVRDRGSGFREALRHAIEIHQPFSTSGLPTVASIVGDKHRFAMSRWRGDSPRPGFAMYPHDPDLYVMGWAGQSEAPGFALQVLAGRLADPDAASVARRCLDVLAQAPFDDNGFRLALNGRSGVWSRQDPISQGQAMTTFARAIRAARDRGVDVPDWDRFLRRACAVHAERILADGWQPRSTNEGFLIAPLALASRLYDEDRLARAAIKAADRYMERHLSMDEPYWGGTLDARCEDKEGAWAALEGFLAAWDLTGERSYLRAAEHACDVVLSYTVLWDIDLPPGRLRDHALRTRGWTSVSVQNMHLDVYGVLFTPDVWRLGALTDRDDLKRLAIVMYRSAGQMIDPSGSQGEQLQQTRFAQGGDLSDPRRDRGSYVEDWTVFWITAHFLTAAARFEEMGVLEEIWTAP